MNRILVGDVVSGLAQLPEGCVQTCVTSPPYYGLRDYGVAGQIGLEPTPEEFIARMVEVFRAVHRVLRPDGTVDEHGRQLRRQSIGPGHKLSAAEQAQQPRASAQRPESDRVAPARQRRAWECYVAARDLGRNYVGCELNPAYAAMAERRIASTQPGLQLA